MNVRRAQSRDLVVAELDPDDTNWIRLTENARGSTVAHHATVSQVAALGPGCRLVAVGAWRGAQLVGGAVVVANEGHRGSVWPRSLAPYNGPLIAPLPDARPSTRHHHESTIATALLDEVARQHAFVSVRVRPRSIDIRRLLSKGWTATTTFTYELRLDDADAVWGRIDSNRRRLIRRALDRGYTASEWTGAPSGVADELSRLHALMHSDYDTPVDLDLAGWRSALPALFDARVARLFIAADRHGAAVAFVLVARVQNRATVVAIGADHARLDDGATALVRWEMLRTLADESVETIDLNGARLGSQGRFKASFGGELVDRWDLTSPPQPAGLRSMPRLFAAALRSDLSRTRSNR